MLWEQKTRHFSTQAPLMDLSRLLMYGNFNLTDANAITRPAIQLLCFFSLFQIDALSKRSKESEAAFLSVYKRLIDVPGMSRLALCRLLAHSHADTLAHTAVVFHWGEYTVNTSVIFMRPASPVSKTHAHARNDPFNDFYGLRDSLRSTPETGKKLGF